MSDSVHVESKRTKRALAADFAAPFSIGWRFDWARSIEDKVGNTTVPCLNFLDDLQPVDIGRKVAESLTSATQMAAHFHRLAAGQAKPRSWNWHESIADMSTNRLVRESSPPDETRPDGEFFSWPQIVGQLGRPLQVQAFNHLKSLKLTV